MVYLKALHLPPRRRGARPSGRHRVELGLISPRDRPVIDQRVEARGSTIEAAEQAVSNRSYDLPAGMVDAAEQIHHWLPGRPGSPRNRHRPSIGAASALLRWGRRNSAGEPQSEPVPEWVSRAACGPSACPVAVSRPICIRICLHFATFSAGVPDQLPAMPEPTYRSTRQPVWCHTSTPQIRNSSSTAALVTVAVGGCRVGVLGHDDACPGATDGRRRGNPMLAHMS